MTSATGDEIAVRVTIAVREFPGSKLFSVQQHRSFAHDYISPKNKIIPGGADELQVLMIGRKKRRCARNTPVK